MKVEIGKTYEVCTTYIAGYCDTCSIIKVENEKQKEYVQAYVDDPRDRVSVIEIDEANNENN